MCRTLAAVLIALCLAVVSSHSANAAPPKELNPSTGLFIRGNPGAANTPAAAALRAKAAKGGVRIFVKMAIALTDEDHLDSAAAARQAQALTAARDGLIARTLHAAQPRHRIRSYDTIPYVAMTVNADELARILSDGEVEWIGEVGLNQALASTPWNIAKIKVDKLWDDGRNGSGFAVAVLDSGAQESHPMLGGRVVEEMCYSTTNKAKHAKTLCPNGMAKMVGANAARNCSVAFSSACEHGTHVAGIAGGGRWSGTVGVAPGVDLILGQIFSKITDPSDPPDRIGAFDDDIVSGLERVYSLRKKYKIAAVNLSLGGGLYSKSCDTDAMAFVDIFRLLREAKIAPVVASGNDSAAGFISKPACASGAIVVGATDKADKIASFSNHSQLVTLLAPGVGIVSSVPGSKKESMDGTSMATPHVAGAVAVLRDVKPSAEVAEIVRALACTGKKVSAVGIPKRRIDVDAAREVLLAPTNKPVTFTFNNATDVKKWKPAIGSKWSVKNGEYVPSLDTSYSQAMSFTPNCDSDLDLDVSVSGAATHGDFGLGVLLKAQVDKTGNYLSGYGFFFSESYNSSDKKYTFTMGISRYEQFNVKTSTGGGTGLYSECGATNSQPVKSIKVKVRGAQMSWYLDGHLIATVKDTTYTTGSVGLYAFGRAVNKLAFDDVTITPMDNKGKTSFAENVTGAIADTPAWKKGGSCD
jgi:subtilisin family serine protease